jgi:hypothetical protein
MCACVHALQHTWEQACSRNSLLLSSVPLLTSAQAHSMSLNHPIITSIAPLPQCNGTHIQLFIDVELLCSLFHHRRPQVYFWPLCILQKRTGRTA